MKGGLIVGIVILVSVIVLGVYFYPFSQTAEEINNFHDCANAGYPVMESYPRQCKTPDGRTFTEIIPPPVQEGITSEECADADGRVVNTADGFTCEENEISIGEVGGFAYLHLCCVPFPESKKLTIEEAMEIAQNSECTEKGNLTEEYVYNPNSKTWWINLDMKEEFEKEYCNPACVIYEFTKTAEINWRCMGALPPE